PSTRASMDGAARGAGAGVAGCAPWLRKQIADARAEMQARQQRSRPRSRPKRKPRRRPSPG
ncbi:hypothetical protein, partial [Azoarcus sp. TTM-91]|uniref:hypothetical protein n=1 Tax=Azoarcus sp. TTM-91 TaxID=2691581 RepID=UPI001B7CF5B8